MYKSVTILLFSAIASLYGCGCSNDASLNEDNTAEQKPGQLIRFDKELFAINPDSIPVHVKPMVEKYGNFFELYCTGIIGIAHPSDSTFAEQLHSFFTSSIVKEAHEKVAAAFSDISDINRELRDGFRQYAEIFKGKPIPKVYSYISGYNQALMLMDNAIGVSLDMFLGQDSRIYSELSFPKYMQKNLYRERIPINILTTWAYGEFYFEKMGETLLATMIYEGKLTYFAKTMLPETADTTLFGFREEELQWCLDNEKYMWVELVENKLLFETGYATIKRMTSDGPFTPNIPGSPGKAPGWIGYRIVERYMKRSSASLPELMADDDYRKILEASAYNP